MSSLDRADITRLLARLAQSRPVFHSEADFQHALAWAIHDDRPSAAIRLELPQMISERRAHVDIWVIDDGERVAIELKYLTRKLETTVTNERFKLRDQAAQDLGRYDVLKDLSRIETLVAAGAADTGFVIALTNDTSYWKVPGMASTPNYAAFRLAEGSTIGGTLAWGPSTGPGTMKGREEPIILQRSYQCSWADYAELASGGRYLRLRYLLFECAPA